MGGGVGGGGGVAFIYGNNLIGNKLRHSGQNDVSKVFDNFVGVEFSKIASQLVFERVSLIRLWFASL